MRAHRELLAFCHIEKAAGTSLTHVLRKVFPLRYADVRPMNSRETDWFTARDLRTIKRYNPLLRCIGGHSVVPHSDLLRSPERIRFITQLREPIARAASQYRYWVNFLGYSTSWQEFLRHPTSRNFQVRKIAGCEDIDLAKECIARHFLLAGTVEEFDPFVVVLARLLGMPLARFTYEKQNVGAHRREPPQRLPEAFYDGLRERNELDQQLYAWVRDELFPGYVEAYEGAFASDLAEFRRLQQMGARKRAMSTIDFAYRNAYLKPVSGLTRVVNGLPWQGSYSTR